MTVTFKFKRGTGSDPGASSMTVGEPVLRTDTAELFFKKDDGSVAKVSGGGGGPDFKYLALRNAANNGAASYPAADFTLVTSGTTTAVSPAAASALLVVYAGVIQQPNTGTSTPSSGFAISGSTIKFGSNIAAAPDFIIYQESGGIGEPSDNTVTTAKIVNDAVTADKLANSINSEIAANTAKTTNATHSGEVTGSGALTIADNVVDEANLKVSNSPTNGYFLSAQSGNTGGLTWAEVDLTALNASNLTSGTVAAARLDTATTQSAGNSSTKIATTAFVSTAVTNLIGGAPGALDTLNELAAAINDDSSYASTVTTALGTKANLSGAAFTGEVDIADGQWLDFGNGGLKIRTNSNNAYIKEATSGKLAIQGSNIEIANSDGDETYIYCTDDGAVDLYHNNVKKFETTTVGTTTTGTVQTDGDVKFTSGSRHKFIGGGSGGNLELGTYSSSNSSRDVHLEIDSAGDLFVNDSQKFKFGTGSDLQIYHNGTQNIIGDTTTQLRLISDAIRLRSKTGSETYLECDVNGAVQLNYDNSKKFETLSNGTKTTGNHYITGDLYAESEINMLTSTDSNKFLDVGIGTNAFAIRKTTGGDSGHENMIRAVGDGSVELFHNNTKTFETVANGIKVVATENNHARIHMWADDGDDGPDKWEIMATTQGQLRFYHGASSENTIVLNGDGAVELYYDNAKKFETKSDGVLISGELQTTTLDVNGNSHLDGTLEVTSHIYQADNDIHYFGNGNDLRIFHDGSNSRIKDSGTGNLNLSSSKVQIENPAENEVMAAFIENGACELYYNGSKHFETNSTGAYVTSRLGVASSVSVGTSSLQNSSVASFKGSTYNQVNIAHSGNSSWGLLLTNSANSSSNYHRSTNSGSACAIVVVDNESLHLGTNNQARWSVHHSGHFLPDSNNTYDIGSTSYRVRNLYINDLQLSNEGSSNSVDGTWGDWTLQEGEEDIFMINNRSGKKYKMALQEVS